MKKCKILCLMVFVIMLLTACAKDDAQNDATKSQEETTTESTKESEETQEVENQETNKVDVNIAALKGPTAMGMVKIMEDASTDSTENTYNFTIAGAADEISTGLVKGDIDIAAVPCNLASVLYNKTQGGIKIAGINTLGVLYMVETGDTIQSVADLKGKTIYATGLGTVPQYTLNYILNANGLDPEKDVTIEYKTEPTEVAAMLSESSDAIAMLPQPYVTVVMLSNDKVHIALDMAEEWEKVSTDGSSVVTGVVVVRSEFLENNKEAVEAFMKEYEASASFVNENIEDAASLIEKFDIFKAAPMKKAIPYCSITLIQGDEMKDKVNGYLTALYNQNKESVGGKLPEDDFYFLP